MKTSLTPEQSQRLIELGVDPSKASDFEEVDVTDLTDPNAFIETEYHRVFTLSDIISLLPKDISTDNADYYLDISAVRYNGDWTATYLKCGSSGQSTYGEVAAPELIDALFELLVWVLENHPDKIKRL